MKKLAVLSIVALAFFLAGAKTADANIEIKSSSGYQIINSPCYPDPGPSATLSKDRRNLLAATFEKFLGLSARSTLLAEGDTSYCIEPTEIGISQSFNLGGATQSTNNQSSARSNGFKGYYFSNTYYPKKEMGTIANSSGSQSYTIDDVFQGLVGLPQVEISTRKGTLSYTIGKITTKETRNFTADVLITIPKKSAYTYDSYYVDIAYSVLRESFEPAYISGPNDPKQCYGGFCTTPVNCDKMFVLGGGGAPDPKVPWACKTRITVSGYPGEVKRWSFANISAGTQLAKYDADIIGTPILIPPPAPTPSPCVSCSTNNAS